MEYLHFALSSQQHAEYRLKSVICFPLQLLKIAMKPECPSQRQFYTQVLKFTLEPPLPSAIILCVYAVYMSVWAALLFFQVLTQKSTLHTHV